MLNTVLLSGTNVIGFVGSKEKKEGGEREEGGGERRAGEQGGGKGEGGKRKGGKKKIVKEQNGGKEGRDT